MDEGPGAPPLDARARRIYEAAPLGIALCDTSLRFLFANRRVESILGYAEADLRRLRLDDLAHPEDEPSLARWLSACFGAPESGEGGEPSPPIELRFVRRDGHVVWCRVAVSGGAGPSGEASVVMTLEDVSERRAAEQRLREGERLVAVGTLAAGIAHEINNPVGSVLASAQYAQMVMGDPDGAEKVAKALRDIVAESRRCGQIVKSVLKFAREEATERWPADLNALVGQATDHSMELARRYGATLEVERAPELPEVLVNPTEIGQLLANLIRNALQSGGFGIHVTIRTSLRDGRVRLSVADDGPGMPPEVRERIFDPFFTTREGAGGTGLGLSLVHGIVSGHGGQVRVHSEPGRGTEVTVELPVYEPVAGR